MNIKELEKAFKLRLEQNEQFQVAQNIIEKNSHGKAWLIGGALSRELAALMHGGDVAEHDFDFVVEKSVLDFSLPKGWTKKTNKYGNPKFVGAGMTIDYIPIETVHSIRRRGLTPTIENFLSGTPFDVQSIAYDIDSGKLIGSVGLQSIQNKTFGINDLEQAHIFADKKGVPLEKLIKSKAASMGFKPIVPSD